MSSPCDCKRGRQSTSCVSVQSPRLALPVAPAASAPRPFPSLGSRVCTRCGRLPKQVPTEVTARWRPLAAGSTQRALQVKSRRQPDLSGESVQLCAGGGPAEGTDSQPDARSSRDSGPARCRALFRSGCPSPQQETKPASRGRRDSRSGAGGRSAAWLSSH